MSNPEEDNSASEGMRPPLPYLANITKLSPHVTRVLGQNPGKFTLQGTNTYLFGTSPSNLVLHDTGAGQVEYIPELRAALKTYGPTVAVTDIILSHWHPDHVEGLPSVLDLLKDLKMSPPRLWKYPCPQHDDWVITYLNSPPAQGAYTKDESGSVLHWFEAEKEFTLGGLTFRVVHTPGHTSDSMSLLFPALGVMFTADTILGHGTPVFDNLSVYIDSLERIIKTLKENGNVHLYPGHGEFVKDGLAKTKEYIGHRQNREDQVMERLRLESSGSSSVQELTVQAITKDLYSGSIPDALMPAATRGIYLHLMKLEVDGKVTRKAGPPVDTSLGWHVMAGYNDFWRVKDPDSVKI